MTDSDASPPTHAINVLLAVHGRVPMLRRTIESLAQVRRPRGFEAVWVIENGSDGGARGVCAQMKKALPLEYVHLDRKGKSGALQTGLEKIGRGLLVFTDDDVRFDAGWLDAYASAAAACGDKAFFGGVLEVDYEQPPPDWLKSYLPPSAVGWRPASPDQTIDKACFLGANYGAFVSTLQAVGGYQAHLGIGAEGNPVGEEFEIQDRMLAAGYRGVYLPEACVWHWVPRERCSPNWTLHRHYRIWLTNGMMEGKVHPGPRWRGVPRWMWRRAAQLRLQAWAANFLPDAHQRFKVKDRYWQWRGYMEGVRLRHRREQPEAGGGAGREQ